MNFNGIVSSLVLLLLSLTVSINGIPACPLMNNSMLAPLIAQYHPFSDGHEQLTFQLQDFNITCLSLSNIRDRYQYTTISIAYLLTQYNSTVNAMIDIGCNSHNVWDPTVLGAEVSFKYSTPVPRESLRKDCYMCISNSHPLNSDSSSDTYTHCKACHSNCSITGTLKGCTGPLNNNCCLMYDSNGMCSNDSQCNEGEIMNEISYTCSSSTTKTSVTMETTIKDISIFSSTSLINPTHVDNSIMTSTSLQDTSLPNNNNNNNNNDNTFEAIEMSIISSFITTIVTFSLTFTVTALFITCCFCTRWRCIKRSGETQQQPGHVYNTQSFTTSTEYIEPSTSPSQRPYQRTTDDISMNLNPAYYRIRYFGRPVTVPVTPVNEGYEEIDAGQPNIVSLAPSLPSSATATTANTATGVMPTANKNNPMTVGGTSTINSYITIIP